MNVTVLYSEDANKMLVFLAKEAQKRKQQRVLLTAIEQKLVLLRGNPFLGTSIAKKKIPKKYVLEYKITNLWKIDLPGAWRLLYSIRNERIEIIALVLDVFSHKDYEKKMKYKKS